MANSGESASWADIVKSLMDTFLVLRDIFGYALPGLVFVGIGVASGRLEVQRVHDLLKPYDPPMWVLAGLGIAACYVIGHLLASIAYLPIDVHKWFKRHNQDWLDEHPTEVCSKDLYFRHFYPELFKDMDRRETMGLLMYSTLAAMVLGGMIFYWLVLPLRSTLILISAFVFVDGLTLMQHLTRVRKAIHKAGKEIQKYEEDHAAKGDVKKMLGDSLQAAVDAVKKPAGGK
jgi:hypothetical protein